MYAHVNIWPLEPAGAVPDDTAAHDIGSRLRTLPGFKSYMVIRTGEREVVAVTVFDSERQLEQAMEAVADVVRERVRPLASGEPERRRGEVFFYIA